MDRSGTELKHVVKIVRIWNVRDAAAENPYSIFPKDLCEKWLAKLKESETLLHTGYHNITKADKKGRKHSFDHTGSGSGAISGAGGSSTTHQKSNANTAAAAEDAAGNDSAAADAFAGGGGGGDEVKQKQYITARIYAITIRESPTHPPQWEQQQHTNKHNSTEVSSTLNPGVAADGGGSGTGTGCGGGTNDSEAMLAAAMEVEHEKEKEQRRADDDDAPEDPVLAAAAAAAAGSATTGAYYGGGGANTALYLKHSASINALFTLPPMSSSIGGGDGGGNAVGAVNATTTTATATGSASSSGVPQQQQQQSDVLSELHSGIIRAMCSFQYKIFSTFLSNTAVRRIDRWNLHTVMLSSFYLLHMYLQEEIGSGGHVEHAAALVVACVYLAKKVSELMKLSEWKIGLITFNTQHAIDCTIVHHHHTFFHYIFPLLPTTNHIVTIFLFPTTIYLGRVPVCEGRQAAGGG